MLGADLNVLREHDGGLCGGDRLEAGGEKGKEGKGVLENVFSMRYQ